VLGLIVRILSLDLLRVDDFRKPISGRGDFSWGAGRELATGQNNNLNDLV
jgi:hypothetical protein